MKKFDALGAFIGKKSKFCAEYLPGKGMSLQCSGRDPVDVVLTACFGLKVGVVPETKKLKKG